MCHDICISNRFLHTKLKQVFFPFALITKYLQKIKNDKAKGILVYPLWTCQPCYPLAKMLMVTKPVLFKPNSKLLLPPFSTEHPLSNQICSEHLLILRKLTKYFVSSISPGTLVHSSNTIQPIKADGHSARPSG